MIPQDSNLETSAVAKEDISVDLQQIQLYKKGVEELMRLESKDTISNGVPQHAAILFEVFFKNAKEQVRIFCQNLNASVFNEPNLLQQAEEALKRGVFIKVIVQENPQENNFSELAKGYRNLSIRKVANAFSQQKYNFAVMDSKALRVEPDRSQTKAAACMNIPDTAAKWNDLFDNYIYANSEPIGA